MTLRAIDAVLTFQSLIVGQVVDALTGDPTPYPPMVTLFYQTPPGDPPRPYPLVARVWPDGRFVFAGIPGVALPRLSGGETLPLRLTAQAPSYEPRTVDFTFTAATLALTEQDRTIDGRTVAIELLAAPLRDETLNLTPLPLYLAGRVVRADDPQQPIAGAQVRVTAPAPRGPAATDADGFFSLPNLPIALEITLRAEHPDFDTLDQAIPLDYRQPVNQRTLAMEG